MPPNKNSIRIRKRMHRLLQTLGQILLTNPISLAPCTLQNLLRSILNNRHPQPVKIPHTPHLTRTFGNPLYLLQFLNFKHSRPPLFASVSVVRLSRMFHEQSDKYGPLAMRMNTASRITFLIRGQEERRTCRGLQNRRSAQVGFRRQREDEEICSLHALFLDAGWGDVHEVLVAVGDVGVAGGGCGVEAHGGAAAGAGDPAESVELGAECGDEVGRVEGGGVGDQGVGGGGLRVNGHGWEDEARDVLEGM
jgi:hypothetical protein